MNVTLTAWSLAVPVLAVFDAIVATKSKNTFYFVTIKSKFNYFYLAQDLLKRVLSRLLQTGRQMRNMPCYGAFNNNLNLMLVMHVTYSELSWVSEINVQAIYIGGADVLYNKFNVTTWGPPVNLPTHTASEYNCVVDKGSYYWRLSECKDRHRVLCQSG